MRLHSISAKLGLCSAAAFLASATLLAQAPGSMPSQPQAPAGQPSQPSQSSTAPGAQDAGSATTPQSLGDQAFVSKAMEGNDTEIQLAQLAQQKSQSSDVKQYAQKMAADHTQMNDKWFTPVAKQLGVVQPKGPSKKEKKVIAKLQGLSGDEFDKEYIGTMLKDHQQDLKDFKQESESAQDPTLKQVATQGASVITQHLQLAEQVAKNHNVPVPNNGKEMSEK